MRIALGLEYDGAAFCGWQTQPTGCGVQDHLQRALARFADQPIEVTAAGRTDAGVHASAQVVHFDSPVSREPFSWVRGTNTFLEPQARVLWAALHGVIVLHLSGKLDGAMFDRVLSETMRVISNAYRPEPLMPDIDIPSARQWPKVRSETSSP